MPILDILTSLSHYFAILAHHAARFCGVAEDDVPLTHASPHGDWCAYLGESARTLDHMDHS